MLELLFGAAQETVRSILAIIGLFFVIPGLIQCFFGYRVLKLFAAFMGFLAGLVSFGIIGMATLEAVGPGLLTGLVGGLLLALLAFKAYKAAVCLINGINVFLASVSFGFYYGLEQAVRYFDRDDLMQNLISGGALGVVLAVAAILLTAVFFRPLIICSTALEGGLLLGGGLCMMLYAMDWIAPLSLLCVLAGAIFQFYNTRDEALILKREREEKAQQSQAQGKSGQTPRSFYVQVFMVTILGLVAKAKWDTTGLVFCMVGTFFVSRAYSYFPLKKNFPQQMEGVSLLHFMTHPFYRYVTHPE